MLKDNLLLDSARPFSDDTVNTDHGHPEHCLPGVPQSYLWYALRVSYSRELKVQTKLQEMGVRTFVPMMWKKRTISGNIEKKLVPAVGNLCFAYWTRQNIEDFIRGYGEDSPVHFYWDRTADKPLVVPEKAMEDFMRLAGTMDEDLIYLTEVSSKLKDGQMVKMTSGPFDGVEGRIVRIRKSRRIMVEIPGMLAVASAYVPLEKAGCLNIVE